MKCNAECKSVSSVNQKLSYLESLSLSVPPLT